MENIQSIANQTPIEIALDIDKDNMTTAKKLYDFLELEPKNYSRWCKSNIIDNEFATEDEDYEVFFINEENHKGGRPTQDYKLTARFAKKLSQKANGIKGEQAREYFTNLEERIKQKAIDYSQLTPELQMFQKIFTSVAQQQLEQKRIAKEVEEVKQKQEVIAETFQKSDDTEDFQKWANSCIARIAESPKFNRGYGRKQNYSLARTESYERLKQKRNCRLDDRVEKAMGSVVIA